MMNIISCSPSQIEAHLQVYDNCLTTVLAGLQKIDCFKARHITAMHIHTVSLTTEATEHIKPNR